MLFDGIFMSPLVPLVVVLFEFGLLDNVFVPDLHEHHVDGLVFSSAVRTCETLDILEVQSVNFLAIIACPNFLPLRLFLLVYLNFDIRSRWLCQRLGL